MPFLQSLKPVNSNKINNSNIVSHKFYTHQKDRYKDFCALMLKHSMYAPTGQFRHLWLAADYMDTVYTAYMMVDKRPIGVAFIERGYDFGFPLMPTQAEGFITCYVLPKYRKSGIATTLCKTILEEGAFREVAGQVQLKKAVLKAGDYKYHICL